MNRADQSPASSSGAWIASGSLQSLATPSVPVTRTRQVTLWCDTSGAAGHGTSTESAEATGSPRYSRSPEIVDFVGGLVPVRRSAGDAPRQARRRGGDECGGAAMLGSEIDNGK